MMKFLPVLMSIFYACVLVPAHAQQATDLSTNDFEKSIGQADSIQLLDVRTPDEFNSGHIKNALLADWKNEKEFDRRISFIDKEKPVYIYCLAGGRSAAAADKMRALGYKQVFELKGGINAWKAQNKPLEGKSTEAQMSIDSLNASINAHHVVLVDFGATWCPPCKKMEPVLNRLREKYPGKFHLVKVDGGRDEDILRAYQVTELPVFIFFKEGKQVWRRDGIAEEKEIEALITGVSQVKTP